MFGRNFNPISINFFIFISKKSINKIPIKQVLKVEIHKKYDKINNFKDTLKDPIFVVT